MPNELEHGLREAINGAKARLDKLGDRAAYHTNIRFSVTDTKAEWVITAGPDYNSLETVKGQTLEWCMQELLLRFERKDTDVLPARLAAPAEGL